MDSCCEHKAGELAQLRASQSRVLYVVLAINAVMFCVEFTAGWIASSTALLGDSLDMFGDAAVYALTLFVLDKSRRARAGAALFKGGFMLLFGVVVIADAIRKLVLQEVPAADLMGIVGTLALLANGVCFAMLYSHRADDLNMRSTVEAVGVRGTPTFFVNGRQMTQFGPEPLLQLVEESLPKVQN
jgi:Co/Zn/Cd efflux system component